MDFKTFFEQNKKACVGGLAGIAVILVGLAAVTGRNNDSSLETVTASTEPVETSADTGSNDTATGDFYTKLSAGQPVSVLVVGDGFAAGSNLEDASTAWAELISEKLQDKYSSDVQVENYALPSDNTAYSGYVVANELPDGSDYDAAIISFGNYDDPDTFSTFYESMIRALIKKSPEISIISLIEPSSVTNTDGYSDDNASAIQSITDHYNGLTIDVAEMMSENGSDAASTVADDKINQNSDGNAATADAIVSSIKKAVDSGMKPMDSSVEPLNEGASALDEYAYIPASEFAKINDTTFAIVADSITDVNGNYVSGLLGIDYTYLPGSNDVYVTLDNTPFARSTVEFGGTESERHVFVLNDNCDSSDHITISFTSADEADAFAGIIVSGNVTLPDSYDKFETRDIVEPSSDELNSFFGDDEDTEAEGGPGSEESDIAEGSSDDKLENGATKYIDGALYEYYMGEWYEVINDDSGNPDIGVKQQVVATRSANEIITNKETVTASFDQTAASVETSAAETTVETSAEAVTETTTETSAASDAAAFVNPGEAQAAAGSYSINETDANGNVIGSAVEFAQ